MAITAQSIVDKAAIALTDTDNTRWTEAELLGYLNDACREICIYKPDAYVVNETMQTVAGTKQALPTGGLTLVDVVRNFSGSDSGCSIRQVDMHHLNTILPCWHNESQTAAAQFFCFDPRNQKAFYLYPPSDGDNTGGSETKVEIVYAKVPTDIAIGANILLDDIYSGPIFDYILYRAYSKDADYAAEDKSAQIHYDRFMQAIAGKAAGEVSSEAAVETVERLS